MTTSQRQHNYEEQHSVETTLHRQHNYKEQHSLERHYYVVHQKSNIVEKHAIMLYSVVSNSLEPHA